MRLILVCALILSIVSAGCTDPTSSNITEPLRPLWIVNVDQNRQTIRVSGSVVEQQTSDFYLRRAFENLVRGQAVASWIGNDDPLDSVGNDGSVRLVERDLLRAVDSRGSYPLRRREKLFNYRVSFDYDRNNDALELRLDYRNQRFEPSVSTVRLVDLDNVVLAETDALLSTTDAINVSWNLGDLNLPVRSALVQRIRVLRERCDLEDASENELVLPLAADARSSSIPISSFPAPSSATAGTCDYAVQVMAAEMPQLLLSDDTDGDALQQDTGPALDPVAVVLTQSEVARVQVLYGE